MDKASKKSKPVEISQHVAERYTEPNQFERFDAAVRKVLSVPRAEIQRREEAYKATARQRGKKRGPKPKQLVSSSLPDVGVEAEA